MIRWLARLYEPYLVHLEAEIEWYRVQLIHERRRAERAVDLQLTMRGGAPVTPESTRLDGERETVRQFLDATADVGALE